MPTILKIDPTTAETFVAASVAPKMAYQDGARTDTQATDRATGAPLWRVTVFVMDADSSRAPEQVSVTVPAATAPALPQLAPIRFEGLRVLMWAGGASLRADSVEPLPPDTSPTAAPTAVSSDGFLSDIDVEDGE